MLEPRHQYRRSGRVAWKRFLPLAVLALTSSLAGGLYLAAVYVFGTYVFFGLAAWTGVLIGALVGVAVRLGRCRNASVGVGLGALCGCLAVMSHLQFSLSFETSFANFWRIAELPAYVEMRMNRDAVTSLSSDPEKVVSPTPNENWVLGGSDALLVILIPSAFGFFRSIQPYCDSAGVWMETRRVKVPLGTARRLNRKFEQNDPDQLADLPDPVVTEAEPDTLTLVLARLPHQIPTKWPAFLVTSSIGPLIETAYWLAPEDLEQLKIYFEVLCTAKDKPSFVHLMKMSESFHLDRYATAHRCASHLSLLCLVVALAGFLVCAPFEPVLPSWAIWIFTPLLLFVLVLPSIAHRLGSFLIDRSMEKCAARVIEHRPDRLVDSQDPDAIFVHVHRNLGVNTDTYQAENEFGYLKVDGATKQLLFEGDHERWSIPLESVEFSEVIWHPYSQDRTCLVHLGVRDEGRLCEFHLKVPPQIAALHLGKSSQSRAVSLATRIAAAVG